MVSSIKYYKLKQYSIHSFFEVCKIVFNILFRDWRSFNRKICYIFYLHGQNLLTFKLLNLKRVTALCSVAWFLNIFIFCIKSIKWIQSSDNHIRCTGTLHEHEKDVVNFSDMKTMLTWIKVNFLIKMRHLKWHGMYKLRALKWWEMRLQMKSILS